MPSLTPERNKLLIVDRDVDQYVSAVKKQHLSSLDLFTAAGPEDALPHIAEVNIILGRPDFVADLLPLAKRLAWVQSTFAGVEALCAPGLRRDYLLTGVKNVFGPLMSEYVFAYVLAIERNLFETRRQQETVRWQKLAYRSLEGLTMGIAGLGDIGGHIAQTAALFGMRVWGLKRTRGDDPRVEQVFLPSQLRHFLSVLDYLVLVLPDTAQSRHFIDRDAIKMMKASAVLINVGRGASVDEAALIDALQRNRLKGAVLDVFDAEPLAPSSPLWTLPNVLITPHNAAHSFPGQIAAIFCTNYRRFLEDKPLLYGVDIQRGY